MHLQRNENLTDKPQGLSWAFIHLGFVYQNDAVAYRTTFDRNHQQPSTQKK